MAERRDLPLFAWGDALRAARRRRRRLLRRGLVIALICGGLTATFVWPPAPRLVWNASASAPVGLYAIAPHARIKLGDMVLAKTPLAIRDLAAQRRYIPANVPLVKRVAALPGDRICAHGATILINGRTVASRQPRDAHGRALPWWTGCGTLKSGMIFLLIDTLYSFDGRYFGPSADHDLIGKATPLWVR